MNKIKFIVTKFRLVFLILFFSFTISCAFNEKEGETKCGVKSKFGCLAIYLLNGTKPRPSTGTGTGRWCMRRL